MAEAKTFYCANCGGQYSDQELSRAYSHKCVQRLGRDIIKPVASKPVTLDPRPSEFATEMEEAPLVPTFPYSGFKHLTARVAWHDNGWNGQICADPDSNVYCVGSHSLLSPRLQRRRDLNIERLHRGKNVSSVITSTSSGYFPPCYWSVNAFGDDTFEAKDWHPFGDTRRWKDEFERGVAKIAHPIGPRSISTWCFKLGFDDYEETGERYVEEGELRSRIERYLADVKEQKTIVFLYANFSNPITGDEDLYLVVGVGLVRTKGRHRIYGIPNDLLSKLRRGDGMSRLNRIEWQFPISLDENLLTYLPYQEYLKWVNEKTGIDQKERWEKLRERSVAVEEDSIIPHFKYVSMHLSHDKAIFVLYKMLGAIRKMKDDMVVDRVVLEATEERLKNLIRLAWNQRGKYPGIANALKVVLRNNVGDLDSAVPNIISFLNSKGGTDGFLDGKFDPLPVPMEFNLALTQMRKNIDRLRFLSMFDLTFPQMIVLNSEVNSTGLETLRDNPYKFLDHYAGDYIDNWDVDKTDYGVGMYQIDVAMIPDEALSGRVAQLSADSPQRVYAVITDILRQAALTEGHSCLTRTDIIGRAARYPLYYIIEEFKLDEPVLKPYENLPDFKKRFNVDPSRSDPTYQLTDIRKIESEIEQAVLTMLKPEKKHPLTKQDRRAISTTVAKELDSAKGKLTVPEKKVMRREHETLYENALSNGFFMLSGRAGSGKTEALANLVKLLRKKYPSEGLKIFILTPTGRASLVVKSRLKGLKLSSRASHGTYVSTIDRFLYRALWDKENRTRTDNTRIYRDMFMPMTKLIKEKEGKWQFLESLKSGLEEWNSKLMPKALIIDEASMVDETKLATLLAYIDFRNLDHLYIVGDERQLPPIGLGRPFVDILQWLKRKGYEENHVHLTTNLRFKANESISQLAELFADDNEVSASEIGEVIAKPNPNLLIRYFDATKEDETREALRKSLSSLRKAKPREPLTTTFSRIFGSGRLEELSRVQLIVPRRVGNLGTEDLNLRIIRQGDSTLTPGTKLICEDNRYVWVNNEGKDEKVIGLSNGSLGYVQENGQVRFDDLEELKDQYPSEDIQGKIDSVIESLSGDFSVLKTDREMSFGYAISAHKSQGSDFDVVIMVISQITPFLVRELFYTAITRPKKKLVLFVDQRIRDTFAEVLEEIHRNSAIENKRTALFEYKPSIFKLYPFQRKDGNWIEPRSKIENLIARSFDEMNVKFDYEPNDFYNAYRIWPDFKINFDDGRYYYIEHIGNMDDLGYRERWFRKRKKYESMKEYPLVVTTSEGTVNSDLTSSLRRIIDDMKKGTLKKTPHGYSLHHYEI